MLCYCISAATMSLSPHRDYFHLIGFHLESDEGGNRRRMCVKMWGGQLERLEVSVRAKAGSHFKQRDIQSYKRMLGNIFHHELCSYF